MGSVYAVRFGKKIISYICVAYLVWTPLGRRILYMWEKNHAFGWLKIFMNWLSTFMIRTTSYIRTCEYRIFVKCDIIFVISSLDTTGSSERGHPPVASYSVRGMPPLGGVASGVVQGFRSSAPIAVVWLCLAKTSARSAFAAAPKLRVLSQCAGFWTMESSPTTHTYSHKCITSTIEFCPVVFLNFDVSNTIKF
jgi:hypothetical protein